MHCSEGVWPRQIGRIIGEIQIRSRRRGRLAETHILEKVKGNEK
jgi:hypothetical protein